MESKIQKIKTDTLCFDHVNPRLAEYGVDGGLSESDILEILWEAMDVQELVQSISASGFFEHEAIIVAKENGKNVVIEGNRRLAAVKVLLHPSLAADRGWDVPKLSSALKKGLDELPAIVASREESWRYLGFKHVNGPAKWGSYAKAVYIADVHRKYKISLSDIAHQIGDRHRTVQRLFRGLMVLEQAEKAKVFNRNDRYNSHLSFSHLYTGLDYPEISEFLGVAAKEDESAAPVAKQKIKELGEFCCWLYGSRKDKLEPVIKSQNPDLRNLNAVLGNIEATEALRSGIPLEKAFEISKPPKAVFEAALIAAKRELTTARGYLTAGYDGSEQLLKIAGTIAELADDVYAEIERKHDQKIKKSRKSRITE